MMRTFAGLHDKDRDDECNEIRGDQYNAAWGYGCDYAGYTVQEYNDIKENNSSINHNDLKEENAPFDHNRNRGCDDYGRS